MLTYEEYVNRFEAKNEAIISQALRCFIALQQLSDDPLAEAAAEEAAVILLAHSLYAETVVDLTNLQ